MKIVFKKSNSSVAYCALSVKSGTRNEGASYPGLAHMTEHMLFKGTLLHSVSYVNSRIELLGGEINAYTTKEETVIYSSVLKEDVSRALSLMMELAFCSTFSQHELDKEKNVVLDEINSYKDSPSELIYDDFEEYLFKGSDLSTPVLGTRKSVRKMDSDIMKNYVRKFFTPSNMVISVVADLQESKLQAMVRKLEDKFAPYYPETSEATLETEQCYSPYVENEPFDITINKKSFQTHCIIGAPAYSFRDSRRIPLILLVNILGGPASNSTLNTLLREKNALVYTVDVSYTQYYDAGVVYIYFGSDKSNADRCVDLIYAELDRCRETLISENKLRQAKKQLIGQLLISSDNGEAQSLSMGKSVLAFGEVIPMERIQEMIEKVTAEELRDCARDVFAKSRLSKLMYR